MNKTLEIALERLMSAARKAERPAAEMPFGFDTRVLARVRTQRRDEDWGVSVLKTAFACATVLVALSFAAHQKLAVTDQQNEFAIADSVIRLSMNP